ncbi:MAG TPA: TonB-dependent receptor [Polyangia bacterium]|nr:TonB-dependent receptor [Polyangia bacterium]
MFAAPALAHEPDEKPESAEPDTAPVLIERVEPSYPEAARLAGIGGTVGLELSIGADGSVGEVKLIRSAGVGLDDAAIAAARKFRFRPAQHDGRPIASTVLFDQRFNIRPHLSAEIAAEPAPTEVAPAPALPENAGTERKSAYETTVVSRGPSSAASASSIRNLDFELRPKTAPNDLLRVVPGLLAVQHQGGGKADQLFLRGFDADHGTDVGVFVDGIPINLPSHAHGQGFADLHWLIPEAIERIDVVKGPYDVRFGDFSTAGAVNLITRERFESSSVSYTLGMFPSLGAGKAAATGRFVGIAAPELPGWAAKLHPWVAFEAAYDDGPFDHPERLKRYNLFSKISYDLSPRSQLGVFVQAYGSGWTGSGQIPAREVSAGRLSQFGSEDPSEGGVTERQMFTAFFKHKDAINEIEATAYVTRYRLSLWNDFTFFLGDPVHGSELEQDDARVYAGANFAWHFHRRWRSISLRTTMGASARWDGVHVERWNAESQNGDFRQRLAPIDSDDVDQTNLAGYLEEDVVFNRFVRAIGGVRVDYFAFDVAGTDRGTKQKALVSPKATLVVSPLPDKLDLYLNFGMGFHSNQAQAALADGATRASPSGGTFVVQAVPRIYGGELGARVHLFNRVDAAAAFWVSYLENETVFDADTATFVPSAATRRLGFDLEVRARILRWLYADFDLAQADPVSLPNGAPSGGLALAPRLYLTGGLTAKHDFGERAGVVRGGLRFRYLGARPAFDENSAEYRQFAASDPSRVNTQSYFIVDLYGAYRWSFLEGSLAIQNLFDSTWREAEFGNHSCTHDETYNPASPHFAECGVSQPSRPGVADVHFTPGVPINLQFTLKAYF